MSIATRIAALTLGLALLAHADERKPYAGQCAAPIDPYFANEVWPKVGAQTCVECHTAGGDAEESAFLLLDPRRIKLESPDEMLRRNQAEFIKIARMKDGDDFRILLKPIGQLKHGGNRVIKPDSAAHKILTEYVRRLHNPTAAVTIPEDKNTRPFFEGVIMLDDARLLRRVTLSLGGRLPTQSELAAIARQGRAALPAILDKLMTEEAFFTRLREAFNDIFLTVGYDDVPENALSYEHFSKTRGWAEKHDLSHIKDEKARQQARYKLSGEYRAAMLGEPMQLIDYIVRHNRPFSEIITADYIMVSPYTARGYGIYDQLKDKFEDTDDPFEYIPVKLKALVARTKDDNQESATGFYPHAGILSTFQWMKRYPTTETNRNRARARVFYQQFLGVDVLELAARVADAAAVTAKYDNPTMQASECVVCHKTLDPVAGLFQDYWKFEGVYGPRKGGWFKDMFPAGYEGADLPKEDRWRALQWLGQRTVKDPRFAVAMTEHAWYLLTGRKALIAPKDIDDPLFAARRRAYQEQRKLFESIAARFAKSNFNFKSVLKDLIESDFYRADGLATADANPARRAELDDVGLVRMLAPEQVERKLAAIFGQPWGKLRDEQMQMLYGGIDSKEVTERAADPSGAMGAIQRIMSNDVALKNTALDFSREPANRKLFPNIEPDVVPGTPEADEKIRAAITHLHDRILGQSDAKDVERTYNLFAGIVKDASDKKLEKQEIWSGRQKLYRPVPDPHYTVRAWRGVVTYLLRRQEFLYE